MLYDIYQAIKTKLSSLGLPHEWYNVQYEETIISDKGLFVEFPDPLVFDDISKDGTRATVRVRVHIYSKALRTTDGIPDAAVAGHETTALAVKDLLQNWDSAIDGLTRLRFRQWQHWHRYRGWMVTFVEFECKRSI